MRKKNITILAIGDREDYDAYKKFNKERCLFLKNGFNYFNVDYKRVLAGKIPETQTKKVIVFLFFPFCYWNKCIEHKDYRGIYGNLVFFKKFVHFYKKINKIIKNALFDKEIFFINDPLSSALYRDKLEIKKKLSEAIILNPKLYKARRVKEVQNWLNKGRNFFLKPRCGSMGKGITFLSWPDWQTNFVFRDNKILSKKSDRGWKFRNITGNNAFLRQLLKKDIFIEQAVDMLILNKMKVDLRVYAFFDKVLYIYPRKNHPDKVTTNITQGGKGDPSLLKILPKQLRIKAKKMAEKTSKILGLSLAGIDIVPDRNLKDVYVVDVNVFPGFPKRRTFNLTKCMIKELIKLLNQGRIRFKLN